jgi:hypothetical protein
VVPAVTIYIVAKCDIVPQVFYSYDHLCVSKITSVCFSGLGLGVALVIYEYYSFFFLVKIFNDWGDLVVNFLCRLII